MKASRIIHLMIAMTITLNINAQDQDRGFIIRYDAISLLGDQTTNSMGVKLGAEYFYRAKSSISLEAMYVFTCDACGESFTKVNTENTNGFSVSAENRNYLVPGKAAFSGFHLGPLVSFLYSSSEMWETFDGGVENHYQVYRYLLTAHVMAGYQFRIAGPLYFNPAFGLGFRFVSSRNENKKGTGSGQHEFPYDKDFESGSKWFPGINISINIGLKL
ncbi:MAG TPA: hypothetical protein VK994_00835 [Bacteroidales bacterium]|nr:hypothetical protein [Bacteroidales bacterium]